VGRIINYPVNLSECIFESELRENSEREAGVGYKISLKP
jgi:hypothetical protein